MYHAFPNTDCPNTDFKQQNVSHSLVQIKRLLKMRYEPEGGELHAIMQCDCPWRTVHDMLAQTTHANQQPAQLCNFRWHKAGLFYLMLVLALHLLHVAYTSLRNSSMWFTPRSASLHLRHPISLCISVDPSPLSASPPFLLSPHCSNMLDPSLNPFCCSLSSPEMLDVLGMSTALDASGSSTYRPMRVIPQSLGWRATLK